MRSIHNNPVLAAVLQIATTLLMAFAPATAWAQAHEARSGSYVLRGSVVASQSFAASTARAHGIEPAADRAVLNVVVERTSGGATVNVPAAVQASTTNLAGVRRGIEMRPVVGDGQVSYLGTFDFLPREVLDFRVVATPEGGSAPIELVYRDRMWAP